MSIEGGDYAPSMLLALRIAATLGLQVEDLFYIASDLPAAPLPRHTVNSSTKES